MKPFSSLFTLTAVLAALTFTGVVAGRTAPAVAATPPPTPPPIGTPEAPTPDASLAPVAPASTLGPSPSPPPHTPARTQPRDARKGLDGVWEVQIQHPSGTDYTHFNVTQQGNQLSGTYLDARGKRYPLSGSVDGQAVRLVVAMPGGTTLLLEGQLDGTSDMIGTLTTTDGEVGFTASYRAKEKWIENVNPSPGGISQPSGGYTPP